MATPITYKKLDDGSWGAWIPAHFGDVVVGETIHVMKRSGQKNAHAVQAIITTYKSGTVVRIMDVVEAAPSEITTTEVELKKSSTKSAIFKVAHKLTKATVKAGDSYQATFAICLKLVISLAKKTKSTAKAVKAQVINRNRADAYDAIMNEGYSERGNFNPYRFNNNL